MTIKKKRMKQGHVSKYACHKARCNHNLTINAMPQKPDPEKAQQIEIQQKISFAGPNDNGLITQPLATMC
jgi:hypothetical protein